MPYEARLLPSTQTLPLLAPRPVRPQNSAPLRYSRLQGQEVGLPHGPPQQPRLPRLYHPSLSQPLWITYWMLLPVPSESHMELIHTGSQVLGNPSKGPFQTTLTSNSVVANPCALPLQERLPCSPTLSGLHHRQHERRGRILPPCTPRQRLNRQRST